MLKGLQDAIGVTVVHYSKGDDGWRFAAENELAGCDPDPNEHAATLKQLYMKADPNYTGKLLVSKYAIRFIEILNHNNYCMA